MIINIEISDELLQKILKYGDLHLDNITDEQIKKIKQSFETKFVDRIADEPHYAFEDYIEDII